MNLLANDFAFYLKNVFADWAIALFMFFAVLLILAVFFKGPKVVIALFVTVTVVAGGFVLAAFIAMLVTWDMLRLIDFAVKWAPTALFLGIILVSTLVNAKRGLRKSLIFLTHAICAAIVSLVFFFVCVNLKAVDKGILAIINKAMGEGGLQSALGVSGNCETLRGILAEYLPKLLGGDWQILLAANPQYIETLGDVAFRFVFAALALVIYNLLVFLLYLLYLVAYPERRHKKKVNEALTVNAADRPYRKHHVGGGLVGLARGITAGLLSLSFIGSAFFIVAGGMGSGTPGDYDFKNDNYNAYYSVYRSIESYDSQGIYKILNMMTDASDTPFYLFAADMVLSGYLDDEENGVDHELIKFREELAALTGFAKDTMNLLMKYGGDDFVAILNGASGSGAFNAIVDIMTIPGFRTEFDDLIEEYDSQTYTVNLGMSLVNAIVDNIDDVSFASSINDDYKELLKILFKKGYLSDTIPDERITKDNLAAGIPVSSDDLSRPCIQVSHLLSKKDVGLIVQMVLSYFSSEQKTALNLIKTFLPELKQLSILETSRAEEFDPVLARLYCYVENKYLTAEGEEGVTYSEIYGENIKWIDELNVLLDATGDALTLWDNVSEGDNTSAIDKALAIFDPESSHYAENVRCYDNLRLALGQSDIFGTVMSTSYIYDMLHQVFSAAGEVYIPKDLVYSRKVNADGSVTMGELYHILGGFKLLNAPENRELAVKFLGETDLITVETLDMLSDTAESEDEDGNTFATYFTESYLLRSLLSSVMIDRGQGVVSIPNVSLEKLPNGEVVNVINKEELGQLLGSLSELTDFVGRLMESSVGGERIALIAESLQQETFAYLVEKNRIYEATVAHFLSTSIRRNEFVVIPQRLISSVDGWVTTVAPNGSEVKGELRSLMDALNLAGADLVQIFGGNFGANALFEMLISFDKNTAEDILDSDILHYNISRYLLDGATAGGIELIVPNGAREKTPAGDNLKYTVKKSELLKLFTAARLGFSENTDTSSLLCKIVANKDVFNTSIIMSASVVYAIVNNSDLRGEITIPGEYLSAGGKTALEDYNSSNVWKAELPRFIDALDEILEIGKKGENFVFDSDNIRDSFLTLFPRLKTASDVKPALTKLYLCYLSDIAKSEITARLDGMLSDVVSEEVLGEAKSHAYYRREELVALVDAMEEMGMTDFGGSADFDISDIGDLNAPSILDPEKSRLEIIYSSRIAAGIITVRLRDGLGEHGLADHSKAYEPGGKIYRIEEISSIYDVFGGVDEFDIAQADPGKIKGYVYDENGATKSYLIASAVSGLVKESGNLIIPVDVLDKEGCILPKELSLVIEVFGGDRFEDLENWSIAEIPDGETREKLFASEILRARLSYDLAHDGNRGVYISSGFVKTVLDIQGETRYIVSEAEFKAFAEAIEAISGEATLTTVPTFSLEEILGYDESTLEILLRSDIMYYQISDCLIGSGIDLEKIEQAAINLSTGEELMKEVIPEKTILAFRGY